ncbi:MFS transporter, partial [Clostridium perfringens]
SYKQRGMASSTFNFTRSLGMTIGITVFGLIQSRSFTGSLSSGGVNNGGLPEGFDLKDPHILVAPETRSLIPSELLKPISDNLASSIAITFAWAIVPAALALAAATLMGRKKLDETAELKREEVVGLEEEGETPDNEKLVMVP